jgi:hypothetical protein
MNDTNVKPVPYEIEMAIERMIERAERWKIIAAEINKEVAK